MKYHIQLCLWALAVLWKRKTITKGDRLRLWRKTINLFLCFTAFADKEKPWTQMRGAMISALLSAIYDYETDWVRIPSFDQSIYRELLHEHVPEGRARTIGWQLFVDDWNNRLSADGLERGSIALLFYRDIIGSGWLMEYMDQEIEYFGRTLQVIDDLLDLEEDRANGHTNCFLTGDRDAYLREVREFGKSAFCKTLESHSMIYHRICMKLFRPQVENKPRMREFIRACRPHNSLFAFALTLVGFKLTGFAQTVAIATGIALSGIAASIMVLNDLLDKDRDIKKGKYLASRYPWHVFNVWKRLSGASLLFLILTTIVSWRCGFLCLVVWALGSLYSIVRPKHPWNTLVVAACVGSPVLAGMAHAWKWDLRSILIFGIVSTTVVLTETIKDIADVDGDYGYKDTFATSRGKIPAIALTFLLGYAPCALIMWYPALAVKALAYCFAPAVFFLPMAATRTYALRWSERILDCFLGALVIVPLIVN